MLLATEIAETTRGHFVKPLADEIAAVVAQGGYISAAQLTDWLQRFELGRDSFIYRLLPVAALFARPPISNFRVGAVALGQSGSLYFGANFEFIGEALSFSVHAEQAAVTHAWLRGETGITKLAISAPPCGYCRQFLCELEGAEQELQILLKSDSVSGEAFTQKPLEYYLPAAFGPADLGVTERLMKPPENGVLNQSDNPLEQAAISAANLSYAPYTHCYAGVSLLTSDGQIVAGRYAESAAHNTGLSPLQCAISYLSLSQPPQAELSIQQAVLAEKAQQPHVSQWKVTQAALDSISPDAVVSYVEL